MKKIAIGLTALTVAATALVPATGAAAAPAEKRTPTNFAFQASGYGTLVRGGQVPAGSDTTAFEAISCTNAAGIKKRNFVASEELPGVGTAEEVTTVLRTKQRGGVTSTVSRSSVARIVLAESNLGQVSIEAVKSVATAKFAGGEFSTDVVTDVGSLTFTPVAGDPQQLPLPSPGESIEVPGGATLTFGSSQESAGAAGARAVAAGLVIEVAPSESTARIAHTRAKLARGVKTGLFRGNSYGVQASALDGNVQVGRQPLALMPCQGTGGNVRTKDTASVPLVPAVTVAGLSTRQKGTQREGRATGFEQAKVAELNLGEGQLVVEAIVGRANVTRFAGGRVESDTKGTRVGTITAGGEEQTFPDSDTLEIPGVARLEREVVERSRQGISVIALRVTLLDGTGAVIDLGAAKLKIGRALD